MGRTQHKKKERNEEKEEGRKEDATCYSVLHSIRRPGDQAGRQPRAFTGGVSELYRKDQLTLDEVLVDVTGGISGLYRWD